MDIKTWKALIASEESADRSEAADQVPEGAAHKDVVPDLVRCLKDSDPLVRTCAADTLGDLPCDASRNALLEALEFEVDPLTRAFLLSSLGRVGRIEDVKEILEQLRDESDSTVQVHGASGLLSCAQRHWYSTIRSMLKATHSGARATAVSHLRNYAEDHLEALDEVKNVAQDVLKSEEERGTADILTEIVTLISSKLKTDNK